MGAKALDFGKVKEEEEEEAAAKVSEAQRPFKRSKKSYIQQFLRQRNVNHNVDSQIKQEEEANHEEQKIDLIASGFEGRVRKIERLIRVFEAGELTCFPPKQNGTL